MSTSMYKLGDLSKEFIYASHFEIFHINFNHFSESYLSRTFLLDNSIDSADARFIVLQNAKLF